MENYIDIMKKSLELSETILEGLQHIQKLLGEGKAEQTVFLFEEILIAYAATVRSIDPILTRLLNDRISEREGEFNQKAELVVAMYEEKNYAKVQEIIQFTLVPQFKKFEMELEEAFGPYVIS